MPAMAANNGTSHPQIEDLIELAGARTRLQRDKAIEQIQALMDDAILPDIMAGAQRLLNRDMWEQQLGGLNLATLCIASTDNDAFAATCTAACTSLLEHPEVRVRLGVCELLRALAAHRGPAVWDDVRDRVLTSIDQHFDRDALLRVRPHPGDVQDPDHSDAKSVSSITSTQSYLTDLLASSYRATTPGTGELRHDTEGWQCLETSFLALRAVMEGSRGFAQHITPELRGMVYTALVHKNRFVREAALYIVAAMVDALEDDALAAILPELAPQLRRGMGDNWSMVRYAACVATRAAVLRARHDDTILSTLIPPICLNRYYVAEGVRAYSQATWQMLAGEGGRDLVAKHVDAVVEHYLWCSKGSNHAVREAACACMAEVLSKVDAAEHHAPRILRALILCFKDASWPVRAAACEACGRCIAARPTACAFALAELYPLFEAHLSDNVPSVRQDAAVALGKCVRAYPDDALSSTVAPMLQRLLIQVRNQPPGGDPLPTRDRVASVRTEREDRARFTNQPMFSCDGPNLTTSVVRRAGGCGEDAGPSRPTEPWETSDGALYLLREVAMAAPEAAVPFLPLYAELANADGFGSAHKLRETAWRVLQPLAQAVGKRAFKQDDVFAPVLHGLARSMTCGAKGCESAAAGCVEWLRGWVGEGVWRGRVELACGGAAAAALL